MTERSFRLVIGIWLVAALFFALPVGIHALMAVLLVEGVTNWRVPGLLSRLRGIAMAEPPPAGSRISFEAERALRLLIVGLLALALFGLPELLWWVPWFIGFALIGAGLSGICPMVQALRWVGMR
ncbi:MAG: hypothetical protein LOY58_04350 [Gammaproteobacteria bacterium]|nr:hypothetical protein [Gammaproteobacteria bacterium]